MNDVLIIDDYLDEKSQAHLEESLLDPYFPWFFNKSSYSISIDEKDFPKSENSVNTFQFIHNFINNDTVSPCINVVDPLIQNIKKIPYKFKQIIRIKGNITVNSPEITAEKYGVPHVDSCIEDKFITAVYYVNDSDGDIVIFNEKYGESQVFTEKTRISPKRGRLVCFDGRYYHSGNNPSKSWPRVVVNLNLMLDINSEIGYN
jgi:hypothetical protein